MKCRVAGGHLPPVRQRLRYGQCNFVRRRAMQSAGIPVACHQPSLIAEPRFHQLRRLTFGVSTDLKAASLQHIVDLVSIPWGQEPS